MSIDVESTRQPTTGDVLDAIRIVLSGESKTAGAIGVIRGLLQLAPDSYGSDGARLLLNLINDGTLSVQVV